VAPHADASLFTRMPENKHADAGVNRTSAMCARGVSALQRTSLESYPLASFSLTLRSTALAALMASCFAHAAGASGRSELAHATFAFENADIAAVAKAMATLLGKDVVVDPRVKGTITFSTDAPVTPARATLLFTEALRGQGFSLVEASGLLKVVPEADAKLRTGVVTTTPSTGSGDHVETQIIRVVHENAANLVAVLRPLITANNTINVNPGNNTLIITDYASNLVRIGSIVAALDTPNAADVEVIPLHNAIASDIAAAISKLSDGGAASAAGASASATSVIADTNLNALLVRAPNEARLAAIRALVNQLDVPGSSGIGVRNVHVIYLENTDATRLATVLRAALPSLDSLKAAGSNSTSVGGSASSPAPPRASPTQGLVGGGAGSTSEVSSTTPVNAAASPSIGGYIQADPASNALIVTAPEPIYRDIRAVVSELDVRRAQLYVESLVVEVDASRALDVGLQWRSIFNISESTQLTLGTVAAALESTSGTNILSTANIVTLDNEEAKIVVGQNVPFVTGSYTTNATSSSTNPFQTIERKDVGLTLRIRPQIGRNGAIRMTILQESSSVASTSSSSGPTTNKRSIESTVVVNDGKILVLGGLIEDSSTQSADAIPVLGNIPLFGGLFRSLGKMRKKTNLLVFLRPVVMRDELQSDTLSVDRYEKIRAHQAELPQHVNETLQDSPPPALPEVLSPPAP